MSEKISLDSSGIIGVIFLPIYIEKECVFRDFHCCVVL